MRHRRLSPPTSGWIALVCVALAAVSLLAPWAPTTDPWGWILWGRELIHFHLDTVVGGAPSWKPLPVLVTTPLALAGGAAPALWMLVARAGGLFSLFLAYRLGDRLGGRAAGVLSVAGLLLSNHWVRSFGHGYTEALATGLLFLAIERALDDRPRQSLVLGAAVTLSRPEAWPLVVAYGAFLVWRRRERWWFAGAVLAVVPALWIVPDWISSGRVFHASAVSELVVPPDMGTALTQAAFVPPLPWSLAAVAGAAIALRSGDRTVLVLSGLLAAWVLLLVAMMAVGYPPSPRFFVIPAALVVLLGAVGIVRLLEAAQPAVPRGVLVLALLAIAVPTLVARVQHSVKAGQDTVTRARLEDDLHRAEQRAGGSRLRRCGFFAFPRRLAWTRAVVSWDLGVPLRRVHQLDTSALGYVQNLSSLRQERLPGTPKGPVDVEGRGAQFVLFAPFGRTPVREAGTRTPLRSLGAAGRWRVLASRASPCQGA
jgi:hypothetical protein